MSGHTPGPLLIVPHPDEDCKIFAIVDGARPEDCREFADGLATVWSGSGGNAEANARLIATAPETLNELSNAALCLEEAANIFAPTMPNLAGVYRAAAGRARAVIAKATDAP